MSTQNTYKGFGDPASRLIHAEEVNRELLQALEWAMRVHFDIRKAQSEPWTDAAKKAIAKARGQS